jgi:hypothetical protein
MYGKHCRRCRHRKTASRRFEIEPLITAGQVKLGRHFFIEQSRAPGVQSLTD